MNKSENNKNNKIIKKNINKNKNNKNNKIGGMALFNGLLLRSKKRETIVEKINDSIRITINEFKNENKKSFLDKIPIFRGIYQIINIILSCIPNIISTSKEIIYKYFKKSVDIKITKFEIILGYILTFILVISFLTLIPNILSLFYDINKRNMMQFIFQLAIFGIYLISFKFSSSLKEVFKYHGAEHKVCNAYEKYGIENITIENVKNESRFHRRCGGNFVVYLIILFLITTIILPSNNILNKTLIEILLFPILIGISYEILFVFSSLNGIFKYLSYPAMIIQYITTSEPEEEKIKLAIYALKGCVNDSNDVVLKEYIDSYTKENLKEINYELNDILRIVSKVTNKEKNNLFINIDKIKLSYQQQITLDILLDKYYINNIPLQYILGVQPFYNEEYIVNENVLIPREDTEILVKKAIEYISKYNYENMIDMCTGSGCVGISIAKNSNIKFGFLVDVSSKALEVANKNNILNETTNKVSILKSNLFDEFKNIQENKYDIIVSNPPYIKTDVIKTLDKHVQNEPLIALDGGKDGLQLYIKIIEQAKLILKEKGILMLEIGYDQLEDIKNIIDKDNNYEFVESVKDLAGNDRVVICRFLQK